MEDVSTVYAKRLLLVNSVCGLELQPQDWEERTAFGAKEQVSLVHLPPAEGFQQMLEKYLDETKGARGSKRAKFEPKMPLEVGRFPVRTKPNPRAILVEGQPWLNAACQPKISFNFFPDIQSVYSSKGGDRTGQVKSLGEFRQRRIQYGHL